MVAKVFKFARNGVKILRRFMIGRIRLDMKKNLPKQAEQNHPLPHRNPRLLPHLLLHLRHPLPRLQKTSWTTGNKRFAQSLRKELLRGSFFAGPIF